MATAIAKLAEKRRAGLKITPMLEQYLRAKEEHSDSLLCFRMGDFYELFFEDAEIAAGVLEITLTSRSKKDDVPIPMCGFPHHSIESYAAKLLGAGFKVALCDQIEEPSAGKKLVARAIVRVMTPGTVTEEQYLDPKKASYLVALWPDGAGCGIVWADLSTGDVRHCLRGDEVGVRDLLLQLSPREILVAKGDARLAELVRAALPEVMISAVPAERFDSSAGAEWTRVASAGAASTDVGGGVRAARGSAGQVATSQPASVAGPLGLADRSVLAGPSVLADPSVLAALGCIVWYLSQTHRSSLDHLRPSREVDTADLLVVDDATRRNLELFATTRGEKRGSLLSVIDQTATPMGGRTLREWVLAPLTDVAAIGRRLDAVEAMIAQPTRRDELRRQLRGVGDLERLTSRLASGRVNPRDLLGLAAALEIVASVASTLDPRDPVALRECAGLLDDLPDVRERIATTIDPEAPLKPTPGALIRVGCDPEIDELRDLAHSGKRYLAELEARERQSTGISSLKVKYNKVFGYYLEVTKANLHLVPASYRRKQTTANAERFVTDELETYEARVLGAEEKLSALEASVFGKLITAIAGRLVELAATARGLALLDVYAALARLADERGYCRPRVHSGRAIRIVEGRHPVVEAMAGRAGFVANDCLLDPDTRQIQILTGPNMAGKSTYLRQVALIVLLAQMGCYVPASEAEIGVVDRLFTRIGAADNLAGGESTFMVEMKETAIIVGQLTPRSLAVLDEIGRGTSTFDGISIAWAVVEHLHDDARRPLVLFATHYHELTDLTRSRSRACNLSVAVREWKGDVLFLRRVVEGPASQSYGIQVAALAGVPDSIVARAKEILLNLEQHELTAEGQAMIAATPVGTADREAGQMALFGARDDGLREELAAADVEKMTPIEALTMLDRLSRRARGQS